MRRWRVSLEIFGKRWGRYCTRSWTIAAGVLQTWASKTRALECGARRSTRNLLASAPLCGQLDCLFDPGDCDGGLGLHQAQVAFRGRVLPDACQTPAGSKTTQKHLSRLVYASNYKLFSSGDQYFKAHMSCVPFVGPGRG